VDGVPEQQFQHVCVGALLQHVQQRELGLHYELLLARVGEVLSGCLSLRLHWDLRIDELCEHPVSSLQLPLRSCLPEENEVLDLGGGTNVLLRAHAQEWSNVLVRLSLLVLDVDVLEGLVHHIELGELLLQLA